MRVEVGEILDGRVTGITAFGAFVALPGGRSGLVHISEVANCYVRDIHEFLQEGQELRVKVIGVSPDGKISLSARQAAPPPTRTEPRPAPRAPDSRRAPAGASDAYVPVPSGDRSFEDKLKRFMQEADGKMAGSPLYQQQRKGQRRRK